MQFFSFRILRHFLLDFPRKEEHCCGLRRELALPVASDEIHPAGLRGLRWCKSQIGWL